MSTEKSALLPKSNEPKKTFYFLNQAAEKTSNAAETTVEINNDLMPDQPINGGILSYLGSFFQRGNQGYRAIDGSKAKTRSVPVKIEPKVFFANERTFLAWLHMSVTLASISIAIVA